jgi:hypothetical protein
VAQTIWPACYCFVPIWVSGEDESHFSPLLVSYLFMSIKCTRHGTGAIDIDSDDELDIDITAAVDTASGNITLEPRLHVSKQPKSTHAQPHATSTTKPQEPAAPSNNAAKSGEEPQNDKRKQV